MYHFEKKTLKNLEIFERKKMGLFEKVTRKFNAHDLRAQFPQSKDFFFLKIFLFFWERFGNLEFFFLKIYIHIYMNKVNQMLHGFLEFKKT